MQSLIIVYSYTVVVIGIDFVIDKQKKLICMLFTSILKAYV